MKKSLQTIILVCTLIISGFTYQASAQNSLHAKINKVDTNEYQLNLALGGMIGQIGLIEIDLLDEEKMSITTFGASVQNNDGQYFLFFNDEFLGFVDNAITVNLNDEILGSTTPVSIEVRLMKDDFSIVNTITSLVENY